MFEPGDWIFYGRPKSGKAGFVIEAVYPKDGDAGHYKIMMDDGTTFVDYHYVFERDVSKELQEKRIKKLLELGI